jgi:hypothetical protein
VGRIGQGDLAAGLAGEVDILVLSNLAVLQDLMREKMVEGGMIQTSGLP